MFSIAPAGLDSHCVGENTNTNSFFFSLIFSFFFFFSIFIDFLFFIFDIMFVIIIIIIWLFINLVFHWPQFIALLYHY